MDATLFKRITTLIDWLNAEVYEFLYPWIQYLMDGILATSSTGE